MFTDSFERGNLTRWGDAAVDGGDLSVSAAAALTGSYGMAALIDDGISIYVKDGEPVDEPRYRARFSFDPNLVIIPDGAEFALFRGQNDSLAVDFTVSLRAVSGAYQVKASLWDDSSTYFDTDYFAVVDSPHVLEIDFRAASGPGGNDGGLTLWIDGVEMGSLQGIDNDTRTVDFVRLGVIDVSAVVIGTIYFDGFASGRTEYIGPP